MRWKCCGLFRAHSLNLMIFLVKMCCSWLSKWFLTNQDTTNHWLRRQHAEHAVHKSFPRSLFLQTRLAQGTMAVKTHSLQTSVWSQPSFLSRATPVDQKTAASGGEETPALDVCFLCCKYRNQCFLLLCCPPYSPWNYGWIGLCRTVDLYHNHFVVYSQTKHCVVSGKDTIFHTTHVIVLGEAEQMSGRREQHSNFARICYFQLVFLSLALLGMGLLVFNTLQYGASESSNKAHSTEINSTNIKGVCATAGTTAGYTTSLCVNQDRCFVTHMQNSSHSTCDLNLNLNGKGTKRHFGENVLLGT